MVLISYWQSQLVTVLTLGLLEKGGGTILLSLIAENPLNMRLMFTTLAPSNHDNEKREISTIGRCSPGRLTGAVDSGWSDAAVVVLWTEDFIEDLLLLFAQVHLHPTVRADVGPVFCFVLNKRKMRFARVRNSNA